jgi:hypothetical protein
MLRARSLAAPAFAFVFTAVLAHGHPALAAVDLTEEEFRLYCGYLDELEKPEVQKLKGANRDKRIAQRAKVKPGELLAAVAKGERVGATCDEIGKKVEVDAKNAVNAAVPNRVVVFNFDDTDPSHVVAQVTWLGLDKRKVVEEAALLANALATEAKIVKTIAIRAVDPAAPDKLSDSAMWWEAKITRAQAGRIDRAKIPDYAATRYLRLFDGCKTIIDEACVAGR